MSTDTDALVVFLRDRLDEAEQVAREASPGPWWVRAVHGTVVVEGDGWSVTSASDLDAAHIARHDPARVLREVEAKRRIIDEHYPVDPCDAHDASGKTIPCDTLLLLALPDADLPDYRESWRP